MRRIFFVLIFAFAASGCAVQNPEELDRLVKEDPAFKQMIDTRDKMRADAKLIKDDLLLRKRTLDTQVEKLRQDYDVYAKAQNVKIDKYRNVLEAYRKALSKDIEDASFSLQNKQAELAGYEKTLQDVRKVLHESKGISLSPQEKEKWQERILMLSEKMRPLTEEIQDLKLKIRLHKKKIGFLN